MTVVPVVPRVRVFSQGAFPPTSEHELVSRARSHFRAELSFSVRQSGRAGAHFEGLFSEASGAFAFEADVRATTSDDFFAADRAEIQGRAGGMALLARRCASVWVINHVDERPADWSFLALLASVLLGPILPADGATLLGVRSARLRSEAAAEAAKANAGAASSG